MLNFTFKTVSSCCTDRFNKFFLFVMFHFYQAFFHIHLKYSYLLGSVLGWGAYLAVMTFYVSKLSSRLRGQHAQQLLPRTDKQGAILSDKPFMGHSTVQNKKILFVASQITYNQYTFSLPIAARSKICSEYAASLQQVIWVANWYVQPSMPV